MRSENIFITGAAGFIGSAFLRFVLKKKSYKKIIVIDKLSYSGNIATIQNEIKKKNVIFKKLDIGNNNVIKKLLFKYKPINIVNFAAETHVDNSIKNISSFIDTNIVSTVNFFYNCMNYHKKINKKKFRFIHISTDEVYGSLSKKEKSFSELSNYSPNNPYSATKASGDHFARALFKTFKFPIIISNCSNNYGPYQHTEKLIPLIIKRCLQKRKIPIYGKGDNIRDWLHVDDHCAAIYKILKAGIIGEKYNIGGTEETTNIKIVKSICKYFEKSYNKEFQYTDLITFVEDRKGHDFRYSINFQKIKRLGWHPKISLENGLKETVSWYLNNTKWLKTISKKK